MLATVAHYRPAIFFMENVPGIIQYRLLGVKEGGAIHGGISQGVMKLVCRYMTSLGYVYLHSHPAHQRLLNFHRYQGGFRIVYSAHYGSPQDRMRVLGEWTLPETPLPSYPIPTHHHIPRQAKIKLNNSQVIMPATRALGPSDHHFGAPFRPVSIDDAISDLVSVFCSFKMHIFHLISFTETI